MTKDEISMELAIHLIMGTKLPENSINELMRSMCEEVVQEREGRKLSDSKENLAGA